VAEPKPDHLHIDGPLPGGRRGLPRLAVVEGLIGLGLFCFALFALWQIFQIPVSPLYSKIGPRVFPLMAVGGLLMLSLLLVRKALDGGWQDLEEKAVRPDSRSMLLIAAGLLANVLLIGPLGFTLASAIMFTMVAWGFGSRRHLFDAGLGFVLALGTYFGFAKALGVNIGAGVIEQLLGG
jgi:putative tricarboxylic transport membrane protein